MEDEDLKEAFLALFKKIREDSWKELFKNRKEYCKAWNERVEREKQAEREKNRLKERKR